MRAFLLCFLCLQRIGDICIICFETDGNWFRGCSRPSSFGANMLCVVIRLFRICIVFYCALTEIGRGAGRYTTGDLSLKATESVMT